MNDRSRIAHAVVVGGGRWARVTLAELDSVLPPTVPVTVVSPRASGSMTEWIASAGLQRPCEAKTGFDGLTATAGIGLAIIANQPSGHAAAASTMIERGYHVLVEKPFAIDPLQARNTVHLARSRNVALVAGLPLLFMPSITAFRSTLEIPLESITDVEIVWGDPAIEQRYGETKRPSTTISIVMDVVPHIWSIVRAIFGIDAPIEMTLIGVSRGGLEVDVGLTVGAACGTVRLCRHAPARKRFISLHAGKASASLDFTTDPATATFHDGKSMGFPSRDGQGGALAREYRFLMERAVTTLSSKEAPAHPADATSTLEHVDLAYALDVGVREKQRELIRRRIEDGTLANDQDALIAVRELMTEPLVAAGMLQYGHDAAIDRLVSALAEAVRETR